MTHFIDPPYLWTDQELYHAAQTYTPGLYHQKDNHDTHDIGFILYCSFGNGIRLLNHNATTRSHDQDKDKDKDKDKVDDGNASYDTYVQVLLDGAQSLASRFNPTVGCIQVWTCRRQYTIDIESYHFHSKQLI